MASQDLNKFLNGDVYQVADYVKFCNEASRLSKATFFELFKRRLGCSAGDHKKKIDALRIAFAEFVRTVLHLEESALIVKRTKLDDMLDDMWVLTCANAEGKSNAQVKSIVNAPRGVDEAISKLHDLFDNSEEDSGKIVSALIDVVSKLNDENKLLKKSVQSLSASLRRAEVAHVELKGDVEKLKIESSKLGNFKYSSVKLASQTEQGESANGKKRRVVDLSDEETVLAPNEQSGNWKVSGTKDRDATLSYSRVLCNQNRASQDHQQNARDTPKMLSFRTSSASVNHVRPVNVKISQAKSSNKDYTKRPRFVLGSNRDIGQSGGIRAAVRRFHYYVGGWDLSVSEADVKSYVETHIGPVLDISELVCKHQRFKSFRITVEDVHNESMLNPQKWIKNIRVKRFFFSRQTKVSTYNISENKQSKSSDQSEVIEINQPSNTAAHDADNLNMESS